MRNPPTGAIQKIQSILFAFTRFPSRLLKTPPVCDILKDPKVITLTRLENVGDMLVFIPTLKNLRAHYPKSRICLITKSDLGKNTISGCPYIDEIIHFGDSPAGTWRIVNRLRELKPDLFFISTQDCGRVKWGFLSGAKVIVGYRNTLEYNRPRKVKLAGFITFAPVFDPTKNEIQRNLELLRVIGINRLDPAMDFSWPSLADQTAVERLFEEKGLTGDDFIVALAPGTKRRPKAWFPERFAQVADRLAESRQAKIIILGTAGEAKEAERIAGLMKYPLINLTGKTSLTQVPVLIRKTNLLITVDSGPMHFAAAVGTPYVALFGPGEFVKWAHTDCPARQQNIYKGVACSPCKKKSCDNPRCMKAITVEEVLEKCSLINKAEIRNEKDFQPLKPRDRI